MKVLMLSRDALNPRLREYAALVEELRVVTARRDWNVFGKWDLVTVQDPFENGLIGWVIARFCGARLELQVHTDFLSPFYARERFVNRVRVMIAKLLLPRADCVRVVSVRIAEKLTKLTSLTKLSVLPIFVDGEKIKNAPITTDLHTKYSQFEKIILMASRLVREKNFPLALDAFAEIVREFPKTGLVIVGSGPLAGELHWKNVVLESWTDDLASYYKTADLFLNTSNYEGYGMTLVEAAAAGCPIVTTDVGCVGEVFTEKNALVVPVGDKPALVSALRRALKGDIPKPSVHLISKQEYLAKMKEIWYRCSCI